MVPVQLRTPHRVLHRLLFALVLLASPSAIPAAAGAQSAPRQAAAASAASAAARGTATIDLPAVPATADAVAPGATLDAALAAAETEATAAAPPFAAAAIAGVRTTTVPADALARPSSVAPSALARRAASGLQHSQVLMIVGGTAVLLGLVTDGAASDVLLIGGAGVGLFGLYRYLQ